MTCIQILIQTAVGTKITVTLIGKQTWHKKVLITMDRINKPTD